MSYFWQEDLFFFHALWPNGLMHGPNQRNESFSKKKFQLFPLLGTRKVLVIYCTYLVDIRIALCLVFNPLSMIFFVKQTIVILVHIRTYVKDLTLCNPLIPPSKLFIQPNWQTPSFLCPQAPSSDWQQALTCSSLCVASKAQSGSHK